MRLIRLNVGTVHSSCPTRSSGYLYHNDSPQMMMRNEVPLNVVQEVVFTLATRLLRDTLCEHQIQDNFVLQKQRRLSTAYSFV